MGPYYVYIVSNARRTVLYIGMTDDVWRRVGEHKSGSGSMFTKKYNCTDLLFFEEHTSVEEAFERERALKKWKREWKLKLIIQQNPEMIDLAADWY